VGHGNEHAFLVGRCSKKLVQQVRKGLLTLNKKAKEQLLLRALI
jgi:hypothetical protein